MANTTKTENKNKSPETKSMSMYERYFGEYSTDKNGVKAKAFDELAKLYFAKNFGSLSKTDIDLLMFHLYLHNIPENTTDYEISNALAITQQRVRNYRIKDRLKYAETEYDWKDKLAALVTDYGNYDEKTRRISLLIKDPNLFIEIENELEKQNCFIDYQLNKKILHLRVEYYIKLIILTITDETKREKVYETLKKNSGNDSFDQKHLGQNLLQCGVDITTILANISSIVSDTNPLLNALKFVLKM